MVYSILGVISEVIASLQFIPYLRYRCVTGNSMDVLAGILVTIVLIAFSVFPIWLGVALYRKARKRRAEESQRMEAEAAERRRIKECGEVVLFYANNFGYIAKQCISRDELEELIDDGISPEELSGEIADRINETDGMVLGYQPFGEWQFDVKLTQHYRDRHVYIVGKSGVGKTNLLRNLIYQDMDAGNGIGVIAPEAEMIDQEILPYVPEHRLDDVIYFNPGDTDAPVTFNPLHLDEGEDIDLKADENFTIFRRTFGGATGPRMDEILRQAFYALVEKPGATLLDMDKLLDRNNPAFRNQIIRESGDTGTVHFWRDVYPQMPKDAHLPVTNRLGRIVRPRLIRNILCNPQNSLDFRKVMDEGKIVLFNLSDGILGEANSQLLGQLIVSKFQMAVMSRADTAKDVRQPFSLYIDEFQTFTNTATASYEKILSRARKYRLSLILAHQQTHQIPTELIREIFGNVSTMVSFQVSRDDASRMSKEFITEYNGEVINVPLQEILSLKVGEAYCKIGQHSFFMRTYLADQSPDYERARYITARSRNNYGVESQKEQRETAKTEKQQASDEIDPTRVF